MSVFETKAVAAPGPTPSPDETPQIPEQGDDSAVGWSGDEVVEGDGIEVSDPADAYSRFEGEEGLEAWLDIREDRTLMGWVRDPGGQTFRYTDARQWAKDVTAAGMTEVTEPVAEDAPSDEAATAATESDDSGIDSALQLLDGL